MSSFSSGQHSLSKHHVSCHHFRRSSSLSRQASPDLSDRDEKMDTVRSMSSDMECSSSDGERIEKKPVKSFVSKWKADSITSSENKSKLIFLKNRSFNTRFDVINKKNPERSSDISVSSAIKCQIPYNSNVYTTNQLYLPYQFNYYNVFNVPKSSPMSALYNHNTYRYSQPMQSSALPYVSSQNCFNPTSVVPNYYVSRYAPIKPNFEVKPAETFKKKMASTSMDRELPTSENTPESSSENEVKEEPAFVRDSSLDRSVELSPLSEKPDTFVATKDSFEFSPVDEAPFKRLPLSENEQTDKATDLKTTSDTEQQFEALDRTEVSGIPIKAPKKKPAKNHFPRDLCFLYEHLIDSGASQILFDDLGRKRRRSSATVKPVQKKRSLVKKEKAYKKKFTEKLTLFRLEKPSKASSVPEIASNDFSGLIVSEIEPCKFSKFIEDRFTNLLLSAQCL